MVDLKSPRSRLNLAALESALAGLMLGTLLLASQAAAEPLTASARMRAFSQPILELAGHLEAGHQKAVERLNSYGFEKEVAEIRTLSRSRSLELSSDGSLMEEEGVEQLRRGGGPNLSASTLTETMFRLNELAEPRTGGERFLRVLYDNEAKNSAQLSKDPAFEFLRKKFSAADMDLKVNPLKFAPISELAKAGPHKPLSGNVERAINKLADIFAEPHLSRVRHAMERHLKLGKTPRAVRAVVEHAIANSRTRHEALLAILAAHVPPPTREKALQGLFVDLRQSSAAMQRDPNVDSIIKDFSESREREPAGAGVLRKNPELRKFFNHMNRRFRR